MAHMEEYAQIDLSSPIIITCTKIILSILFYISGWCCRQKEYNSRNEIAVFFKKRLIRIYSLYLFALVAMVIVCVYNCMPFSSYNCFFYTENI